MAAESGVVVTPGYDGILVDKVQTVALIFNGVILTYVVVRLERAFHLAGEKMRGALTHQQETHRSINAIWARINEIETRVGMKSDLQMTLATIVKRLNDLEER
jgi:hypothetical protein